MNGKKTIARHNLKQDVIDNQNEVIEDILFSFPYVHTEESLRKKNILEIQKIIKRGNERNKKANDDLKI